ncbi:hypothetical protein JF544_09700 [Halobacillus kuroshimensis]|uniref:DUF2642 domain-containing protein n=1 Tax=Halobacillus kuroshimensis TaxID=302481 RepID=A0ABS3DW45_9BACI|nr:MULTISPECIES: hypothetical protein [Halobacillus]MBN8235526.1 hypothetical protein [Halobacillus kuroshimensis]
MQIVRTPLLLSKVDKHIGTMLLLYTASQVYYGKVDMVQGREIYMTIGDRVLIIDGRTLVHVCPA